MRFAHDNSSLAFACRGALRADACLDVALCAESGRQVKIRARLGVSPGPLMLYGPTTSTVARCGTVVYPNCTPVCRSPVVESTRCTRSSTYAADFLMNVTAIGCGPALMGRRISRGAGDGAPRPGAPPPRM